MHSTRSSSVFIRLHPIFICGKKEFSLTQPKMLQRRMHPRMIVGWREQARG
jgi:hypothetical protein